MRQKQVDGFQTGAQVRAGRTEVGNPYRPRRDFVPSATSISKPVVARCKAFHIGTAKSFNAQMATAIFNPSVSPRHRQRRLTVGSSAPRRGPPRFHASQPDEGRHE
jgi:hypothetical protein